MSFERLPFKAHLDELRRRLITCFVTIAVAFVLCYAFSDFLVSMLFYPVNQALPPGSSLVFTALTEGFMTYLKVAFWSAVILSTPMILYQTWKFVAPGLYDKEKKFTKETASIFAQLVAPYAPHVGEEIWKITGHDKSLSTEAWPVFNADLATDDMITMAVQVMGKTRGTVEVAPDISKEEFLALAKEKVAKYLDGKTIVKEIYVPGKICNFVAK
jgi:hypothetical protein